MRRKVLVLLMLILLPSQAMSADETLQSMTRQLIENPKLTGDVAFMSAFRRAAAQKGAVRALPAELKTKLEAMIRARQAQVKSSGLEKSELTNSKDPKIAKRVKGSEGIDFPQADPRPSPPFSVAPATQAWRNGFARLTDKERKDKPAPPLQKCPRDETIRIPIKYRKDADVPAAAKKGIKLLDTLYLNEPAPVDAKEIFGSRTKVVHYQAGSTARDVRIAAGLGVLCLPWRTRLTAKSLYWDLGANALRNYDGDPDGKGELHEYMKVKENLGPRRKR